MEDVLHLLICSSYQREFESIVQAESWNHISLHTFPQACIHPHLCKRAAEKIHQAGEDYHDQTLLACECFALPSTQELGLKPGQVRHLDQCFYMLTNRPLVDHYVGQGSYILTPGWLESWRAHLERWGFDQQTGRDFFHESTRKLLLLDTGVNSHSLAALQDMGAYLDLPVEHIPIGTDHLRLFLSKVVTDWQNENKHTRILAEIAEANRKSADYAMAFDLLSNLTQIKNEYEAIETIIDLFTMLFSPGSVSFCPVTGQNFGAPLECQQDEESRELMQRWARENLEDYCWTSSGAGFFLRFRHQSDTVGVLRVEDIKFTKYKHLYLNLSLSIANLCGLTISNARTYQRLEQAEIMARWEKDVSETLRQILSELTLQRDLDELLDHILNALAHVTPFSDAAVSLLEGSALIFKAGRRFSSEGMPIPFPPPDTPLSLESIQAQGQESLIGTLRSTPMIQNYLGGEKNPSWVNIPLILRGELIGFLSLGNQAAQVYSGSETALAQSFADEAAIAIENARLFNEIRKLAVTDSLTGLYNRRHFYDLANAEFLRSRRFGHSLSLLMIDVDLFKGINDTYGHLIGDRVLQNLAKSLLQKGRSGDIAGRFGGEEFTVLLPETDQAGALVLAERLRLKVIEMTLISGQVSVKITISIGVAAIDSDCENLEELFRRSDTALYTAKQCGRNCVRAWNKI